MPIMKSEYQKLKNFRFLETYIMRLKLLVDEIKLILPKGYKVPTFTDDEQKTLKRMISKEFRPFENEIKQIKNNLK